MPKYILDSAYDFDFSLLAISSPEPDYKLCIYINRLLNAELSRNEAIEMNHKNAQAPLSFSCFMYEEDEEDGSRFILLSNRSMHAVTSVDKAAGLSLFDDETNEVKGFLIPELSQADYLLLLKTEDHPNIATAIQSELKKLNFVQTVQNINPGNLASKKNLII